MSQVTQSFCDNHDTLCYRVNQYTPVGRPLSGQTHLSRNSALSLGDPRSFRRKFCVSTEVHHASEWVNQVLICLEVNLSALRNLNSTWCLFFMRTAYHRRKEGVELNTLRWIHLLCCCACSSCMLTKLLSSDLLKLSMRSKGQRKCLGEWKLCHNASRKCTHEKPRKKTEC